MLLFLETALLGNCENSGAIPYLEGYLVPQFSRRIMKTSFEKLKVSLLDTLINSDFLFKTRRYSVALLPFLALIKLTFTIKLLFCNNIKMLFGR